MGRHRKVGRPSKKNEMARMKQHRKMRSSSKSGRKYANKDIKKFRRKYNRQGYTFSK